MRKLMLLILLACETLFGGLLDFRTLDQAKEAYAAGNYAEAAMLYETVENKNDDLRFNLGDAYYKVQKYDEALKQYEQVRKPELRAKALHNMGNAYAKTQKIDEAIASYEEALKQSDDEDTKYNLELLKKQKEQQSQDQQQNDQDQKNDQKQQDKQKQDQKEQEQKNDRQDQKEKQDADEKSSKDQQDDQQKVQNEKQSDEQNEEDKKEKRAKEDERSKEEKSEKEQKAMRQNEAKEEPISDMQERKYEKMLDKRGIRTLMVPLKTEQGGQDNETTDW